MRLSRRPTIEACFTKRCPHLKFVQCSVRRNRLCDLTGKGIEYLLVCLLEEACTATAGRLVRSEYQVFRHRRNSRAYYHRNRTRILQKRREKKFLGLYRPEAAMA
jgi:hypothetical protein